MIKEEILKYNKLCAEFLGFKCSINDQFELPNMMTFPPKNGSNLCHTAKICCLEDMQFHSDWNWVMEVVEAIEKLKYVVQIRTSPTISEKWISYTITIQENTINALWNNKFIIKYESDYSNNETKKEAVVQAIYNFLIWYNETASKK